MPEHQQRTMLLSLNEDLRALMKGIGITHLLCEGRLNDYLLTIGGDQTLLHDIDPTQDSYVLLAQIFIPVVKGQKDTTNYNSIPLTEEKVCYHLDCYRLQDMYNPDEPIKFYVYFNEHYGQYLTRGLQYIKTNLKFTKE